MSTRIHCNASAANNSSRGIMLCGRLSVRCPLLNISRDAVSLSTSWKDLDGTCHKYSSGECRALLKRFSRSKVKGQGRVWTIMPKPYGGDIHFDVVVSRFTGAQPRPRFGSQHRGTCAPRPVESRAGCWVREGFAPSRSPSRCEGPRVF